MSEYKMQRGARLTCESQSGFDLKLLNIERAELLKAARFKNPRIAWDGPYKMWSKIRNAVHMLEGAGYNRMNIFIFMIYNCKLPYSDMKKKLEACRRWGVRVIDCRYRPLDYTEDNYRPGAKPQKPDEYYIHPNWTDSQVRRFRRSVRRQNIATLINLPNRRYIEGCERRKVIA